jgi:SAM-dependent methyltransferase
MSRDTVGAHAARGGPAWLVGPERVRAWLTGFPAAVAAAAEAALESDSLTWVVEPDGELADFRMRPRENVELVYRTLDHAARLLGSAARVVWCLENRANRGLDDFEAEFLFGQRLAIDALGQVERGSARSRLIVVGRLRVESLGLLFRLGPTDGRGSSCLAALRLHGLPLAVLLLDSDQARGLLAEPHGRLVQRIRGLAQANLLSLGLYVPAHRSAAALADLARELEPVQTLARGGEPVRIVRFADPSALDPPLRLFTAAATTPLRWDVSLEMPPPTAGTPVGERALFGPYHLSGAYQPMPFDLRVPAGLWRPLGCLELPRLLLEHFGGDWNRLVRWRTEPDRELLARLLDFRRMERYFQDWEHALYWRQVYHEYRVYNRPRPERSPRCTLVDCGLLDEPDRLVALLRSVRRLVGSSQGRWRVCPPPLFLEHAHAQARGRSPASPERAIGEQRAAHGYLGHIAVEAPLRQDVENFIHWLPDALGTALELGSGYGQLARTLAGRAERYVCVDLDRRMFAGLPDGLRRWATLADIHALPFRDRAFDSVLANNVLEHSYDPLRCLREVRRVLKPGGRLFALIPLDALSRDFSLRSHLWKADLDGVRRAASMAGLTPVRCDVIDLYRLGVDGAFPSCNGQVLKLDAVRAEEPLARTKEEGSRRAA